MKYRRKCHHIDFFLIRIIIVVCDIVEKFLFLRIVCEVLSRETFSCVKIIYIRYAFHEVITIGNHPQHCQGPQLGQHPDHDPAIHSCHHSVQELARNAGKRRPKGRQEHIHRHEHSGNMLSGHDG